MIVLDNAGTRALSLINTQNGANVEVNFSDYTTSTGVYARGVPTLTTISSGTTTSICATPASGVIRDVDYVNVYNTYAGSQNFTVQITSGSGGPFILVFATLAQNESLNYTHGTGWCALDANGNRKVSLGTILASLTVTGNATVGGTLGVTGATTLTALNTSDDITLNNNVQLRWKDSGGTARNILQLDSSNNVYLDNDNAAGAVISFRGATGTLATFTDGGAVTLNHNNSSKFATTSTGVSATGTITGSSSLLLGTNPASTGAIRLANAALVYARNAANSADISILGTDSSNNVSLGDGGASLIINLAGGISGEVTRGASDSGGAGYRVLRIPN